MYNLAKYFEEIVNGDEFTYKLMVSLNELEDNMVSYQGSVCVTTLIGSGAGSNAGREFLELISIDEEEINKAEEEGYLDDMVEVYFGKLTDDLHTLCEEKGVFLGGYNFIVQYNENDGAIDVIGYFEDWEEIDDLDENEWIKRLAISKEFECNITEIANFNEETYEIEGIEYMILDDDTADEKCKDYIEDTLWAFRDTFLASETGIEAIVFEKLSSLCESSNVAIRSIINCTCGIDLFVQSAINADGRGSFLSSYDGEEIEFTDIYGETYYAYRTN